MAIMAETGISVRDELLPRSRMTHSSAGSNTEGITPCRAESRCASVRPVCGSSARTSRIAGKTDSTR